MAFKLAMSAGTFSVQGGDLLMMVQAISKAKFTGINFIETHIRGYVEKDHSIREIRDLLIKYKLHPVSVDALREWQNWENWDAGKRREHQKFAEQFIDQCKGIGCDCVTCISVAENRESHRRMQGFKEMCDIAKASNMRIALEFLPWTDLRNIEMAWDVVREADCSNGGLLLDTFHFFKGGSKIDDLREVPTEKIFLVHLDDAPDLSMDLHEMSSYGRLFPGEGAFPLKKFLDALIVEKGYKGWIVLEVLNKGERNADYSEIARKGKKSMENVLGRYGS
jgi:sugar phosphate isomerase/epimerase